MPPQINPFAWNISLSTQIVFIQSKAARIFSSLIPEGGALGLYGERGMGKTLTLNYIVNPPLDWQESYFQTYIFVFLNCQDTVIPQTPSNFWLQTVKQLDNKLGDNPIKHKCQALLARITESSILTHNDFHEVLDVAAGAGQRIMLVLDDFDCMIRTEPENLDSTRTFLQGFRSLTTRDSNKANIVVATRSSLQELCKPLSAPYYSAFENSFTNYRLRCFSENELLQFLQRVDQTEQSPFTPAEVRYIAFLSGSHPQLAQLAAAEIFDQRIDSGAPLSDLTPVGERFKSLAHGVFVILWYGASEIERVLLMLISLQKLQGKVSKTQYNLSDLTTLFSQRERELVELTERGLLNRTQANPPVWEVFSPIFEWWILKEIESTDPEQLSDRRKVWGNLITQKRADQLGEVIEVLKRNRDAIEAFSQFILRLMGQELPQLPGN